jgi:hypothetical protein
MGTDFAWRDGGPADSHPGAASLRAWNLAFDLGSAWRRTMTAGTLAWLELQASAAETGVEVGRRTVERALERQLRAIGGHPSEQALSSAVDEAMAALSESTAGTSRALADELRASAETGERLTELQRDAVQVLATLLYGLDALRERADRPVTIELD